MNETDYQWLKRNGIYIDLYAFGERVSIILEDDVLEPPDEQLENARWQAARELIK